MLYLGNNPIAGLVKPIAARNIGEIVSSSLPLTDAGLHLLDGSLIQGGGIYQGFVDYIADLYAENPSANYFTTEALWQQSVTTYGVCGKFVYDSVNNTVRLPKITGIIEGTVDVSALGDLVEAGLPNIKNQISIIAAKNQNGTNGAFYTGGYSYTDYEMDWRNFSNDVGSVYAGIDLSKGSSVYKDNFNKVQPQTIKAFYYIVIANSTKTDIQVDIDEIATDLNGKADVDLTNVTDTGYIKMAGASMPSNTYIDLTLGASGASYTAPASGYYWIEKASTQNSQYVDCVVKDSNNTSKFTVSIYYAYGGTIQRILVPVLKNDKLTVSYTAGGATNYFRFFYAQGSESEAS